MRKITGVVQYLVILIFCIITMFIINMALIIWVNFDTKNELAFMPVEYISDHLLGNEKDGFSFADEGMASVDAYDGFAMLIDQDGDVVWNYKMPQEFKMHYSIQEVAVFSKWYLNDYPVYIYTRDDGLFVVGRPKNTVWKYNLIFSVQTIYAYARYMPFLLATNIAVIIIIPPFIFRKKTRRREQERTRWIAGISHDIRTPLAVVIGHAEAVKNSSADVEIIERAVNIEKEMLNIRTRISALNMDNKLTYGMGKWKKENILLSALIRETLCDIINGGVGETYEFDTDIERAVENVCVRGDRELIRRLIENLIYNSIKHNKDGCVIRVELRCDKSLFFIKKCILTISDTGCGINKKQLSKKARSGIGEHGLGIHLVRQIAKFHHWKVKFEANEPHGLVCRITICFSLEFKK